VEEKEIKLEKNQEKNIWMRRWKNIVCDFLLLDNVGWFGGAFNVLSFFLLSLALEISSHLSRVVVDVSSLSHLNL
jgi:hypothetical protein